MNQGVTATEQEKSELLQCYLLYSNYVKLNHTNKNLDF